MNLQKILDRLSLYKEYQDFVFEQFYFIRLPHIEQMKLSKGSLKNLYERYERLTFNQWLYKNGHEDLICSHETNLSLEKFHKFNQ
jgi:hypothetical protein